MPAFLFVLAIFFVAIVDIVEANRLFFMHHFPVWCSLIASLWCSFTCSFVLGISFKLVGGSRVLVKCKFNFFSSLFFQEEAHGIRLSLFLRYYNCWCSISRSVNSLGVAEW